MRRLKLRKNNWSSESYRFDEVFIESASQRRVYEVVAKPVVEVSEPKSFGSHRIWFCLCVGLSMHYNSSCMYFMQTTNRHFPH